MIKYQKIRDKQIQRQLQIIMINKYLKKIYISRKKDKNLLII